MKVGQVYLVIGIDFIIKWSLASCSWQICYTDTHSHCQQNTTATPCKTQILGLYLKEFSSDNLISFLQVQETKKFFFFFLKKVNKVLELNYCNMHFPDKYYLFLFCWKNTQIGYWVEHRHEGEGGKNWTSVYLYWNGKF